MPKARSGTRLRVRGHLVRGSFRQRAMNELDADRAFADGGSDALDAARAHVADREYPGRARLEEIGRARRRPACRGEIIAAQIGSRANELLVVERDAAFQPARVRRGAGHEKDMADVVHFRLACRAAAPARSVGLAVALE